jgi:hypothetical protein
MHPLNHGGYEVWEDQSIEEIREALKRKSLISMKNVQPKLRSRSQYGRGEDEGRYERVRGEGRDMV